MLSLKDPLEFCLFLGPLLSVCSNFNCIFFTQFLLHVLYMIYLNITRLDIVFILNKLSQIMHRPNHHHWLDHKHMFQYLKSTIIFGLHNTPMIEQNLLVSIIGLVIHQIELPLLVLFVFCSYSNKLEF